MPSVACAATAELEASPEPRPGTLLWDRRGLCVFSHVSHRIPWLCLVPEAAGWFASCPNSKFLLGRPEEPWAGEHCCAVVTAEQGQSTPRDAGTSALLVSTEFGAP